MAVRVSVTLFDISSLLGAVSSGSSELDRVQSLTTAEQYCTAVLQ